MAMGGAYRPFPPALRLVSCFVPGCRSKPYRSYRLPDTRYLGTSCVPVKSQQPLFSCSATLPQFSSTTTSPLAPCASRAFTSASAAVLSSDILVPSRHDSSPITPTRSLQRHRAAKGWRCYLCTISPSPYALHGGPFGELYSVSTLRLTLTEACTTLRRCARFTAEHP